MNIRNPYTFSSSGFYEQELADIDNDESSREISIEDNNWIRRRKQLTKAELAIRKGQLTEAESIYRTCLQEQLSGTDDAVDLFGEAEVRLGLVEVAAAQYRLILDSVNEQYWLLFCGLVQVNTAEKVLDSITIERFPDQYPKIKSAISKLKDRIFYKTNFIEKEIQQDLQKNLINKTSKRTNDYQSLFHDFYPIHFSDNKLLSSQEVAESSKSDMNSAHSLNEVFLFGIHRYFMQRARKMFLVDPNITTRAPRRASAILEVRRKIQIKKENWCSPRFQEVERKVADNFPEPEEPALNEQIKLTISDLKIRLGIGTRPIFRPRSQSSLSKSMMDTYRNQMEIVSSQTTNDIIEYEAHSIMQQYRRQQEILRPPMRRSHTLNLINESPVDRKSDEASTLENEETLSKSQNNEDNDTLTVPTEKSARAPMLGKTLSSSQESSTSVHSFNDESPMTEINDISCENTPLLHTSTSDSIEQCENLTNVFIHLIRMLIKIGENLFIDKKHAEAYQIYERTLYIYQLLEQNITQDETIPFLLRRLGVIRFYFGNIPGSLRLLEQAIEIYDQTAAVSGRNIALQKSETLYEIGEAHLSESNGVDLARKTVAIRIRNHLERYAQGQTRDKFTNFISSKEMEQLQGEEYDHRGVKEAESCYERSEKELAEVDVTDEKIHENMKNCQVRLFIRRGDCYMIAGKYDQAIYFYEQALTLFPQTSGIGLLEANSHVLCMLGTAHMLLDNFPKACSVLDCAQLMAAHRIHPTPPIVNSAKGEFVQHDIRFFITGLLAICTSRSKDCHKTVYWGSRCVSYCDQTFGNKLEKLKNINDIWLLSEVFIILSQTYMELEEHQMARNILRSALNLNINLRHFTLQYTRILQLLGCNSALRKDYVAAVTYYRRGLEILEETSEQSPSIVLQRIKINRLLGKTLNILGQKGEGSECLIQAESLQTFLKTESMGSIISQKFEDAMSLINDQFSSEKAISRLEEALTFYKASHSRLGSDSLPLLFRLASFSHIRALQLDSNRETLEIAENYYQEALRLEYSPTLLLKYSHLLYDLCRFDESFEIILRVFEESNADEVVCYHAYEEMILPPLLRKEIFVARNGNLTLPVKAYALYLLMLTACERKQYGVAEEIILAIWSQATNPSNWNPYVHALLGYCLLEFGMFGDAAEAFFQCGNLQKWGNFLTFQNYIFAMALDFWKFRVNMCQVIMLSMLFPDV